MAAGTGTFGGDRGPLDLRGRLLQLEREIADHVLSSAKFEGDVTAKLDKLVHLHTQIRVLVAIAILSVGAILATGEWVVRHAVTDALVERGIIHYAR